MVDKYPYGSIGLGTLSWRGQSSLEYALKTYADAGFYALFDEAMIFLPEVDDESKSIAAQHPYRIETSPDNFGIMNGMEEIAKRLKTDYIFFTENDCPLLEDKAECERQITKALALLSQDNACMARMRHTKHFGEKFNIYDKYLRYFPIMDTVAAKARRLLRPSKAKRLCGNAVYVSDAPSHQFPQYIEDVGDGFFLVDCATMAWTNQSIIINRQFFLDTIIPYCKSVPLGRGANGFKAIEVELNNSRFWTQSGWKIACGAGLLTHKRVEARTY
ncbi:MAG: hypothetical protein COA43_03140 [Robiginitomaculum sp.]|nr:MAG: hypothetical protein COA43_03140 [Robiginitomaculum sp.]